MILGQMGECISQALQQMSNATVVDDKLIKKCLDEIAHAMFQSDVQAEIVHKFQYNIEKKVKSLAAGHNKRRIVQKAVFDELCAKLGSGKLSFTPKKGKKNVIMFVGLQGSGKTSTCTKYAYYYQKCGFRPALVSADTFRAAAFDQLKQNARKARIPYHGSYLESDSVKVAIEGVKRFKGEDERYKEENHDLIIVDTSGRHKQEDSLFEEMHQLSNAIRPDLVIFVLDSSIGQAAFDQAQAFKKNVPVGAVIVTKMDGHSKGGGALSAVAATESPVVFIGTGEQMHEFEVFDVKPFVSRLLGLGDWSGFVDTPNQQSELVQLFSAGSYTLRLMYQQLQNVLKMGPISQVMSLLPGPGHSAPVMNYGLQGYEENLSRIKRYTTMMDSMTNEELDTADPKLINGSRMMRIARDSGCPLSDVMDMMLEFKKMARLWESVKDLEFPEQANAQQTSKALQPLLLNQVGGTSGLENFMADG